MAAFLRCEPRGRFADQHLRPPGNIKTGCSARIVRAGCVSDGSIPPSHSRQPGDPIQFRQHLTFNQVVNRLTRAECQILQYLRLAITERQIALNVHRSPHTVHVHIKNIYSKLNIRSREQLRDLFAGHPAAGMIPPHIIPFPKPQIGVIRSNPNLYAVT